MISSNVPRAADSLISRIAAGPERPAALQRGLITQRARARFSLVEYRGGHNEARLEFHDTVFVADAKDAAKARRNRSCVPLLPAYSGWRIIVIENASYRSFSPRDRKGIRQSSESNPRFSARW